MISSTILIYGSTTLVLRSPDFGNQLKLELTRINRKSRGGDLIIFRDPTWPITRTLKMKFSYLSELQAQQLLDFIDLSLGQVITVTDFEERIWQGVIITPASEINQPVRDGYSAEFELQGALV